MAAKWATASAAQAAPRHPEPVEDTIDPRELEATGPTTPDPDLIPAPDLVDQIPTKLLSPRVNGSHWYLAAHGGAGATTMAAMDPNGADAEGHWPTHPDGQNVVVVARETVTGLAAARRLAQQWGSGQVPGVNLLALVTVPAHPGKKSRAVNHALRIAASVYPRHFPTDWNPAHLDAEATEARPGKRDTRVIRTITKISTKGRT